MSSEPPRAGDVDWEKRRDFEYASVWRRLMGGVVDWVVAMVWSGLVVVIFFAPSWFGIYSFEANAGSGLIYYFGLPIARAVVILRHVLNAARVMSRGDTFGHRLFGMRVLRADGGRIGWRRALTRQVLGSPVLWGYFSPLLWSGITFLVGDLFDDARWYWVTWGPVVLLVLAGLHHAVMALDGQGRGLHDRMFGMVVVKDR